MAEGCPARAGSDPTQDASLWERRVGLNTTVEGHTLELTDERRGFRPRGQYLDDLLQGRELQPEAAS